MIIIQIITKKRTIHQLVLNALKLIMNISPDLFEICTADYKQNKQL